MADTAELLRPLAEAQAALKAAKTAISKAGKAVDTVRAAHTRAEIAEAELAALRGGVREWGANPSNLQNMYAQLASRTRQWRETKAELAAAQATIVRVCELAERWENALAPDLPYARSLHAALDGQLAPTPSDPGSGG